MSGGKLDVIWSPVHQDKFIVWGQDITLYEVSRLQDIEKKTTFTQLSSTRGAVVVASQSGSGVRCVDVSAIAEHPDPLLALGHASGRVTLTSLKQTYDPLGLVGREFVARYPRPCNSVSWNRRENNLLAVGLEKHRSDNCILLWDVQTCSTDDFIESSSPPASEPPRPVAEVATGETAHTVSWCAFAPRTLVASMNLKHLKIYDLRESGGKACGVANTRQCFGASAAPQGWLVASRGEGGVAVWDARSLAQPLLSLQLPKPPRKIQWSPTRRNLLISLQRDSNSLRLHDIQQAHEYKAQNSLDSVVSAAAALEECEAEAEEGSAVERDITICGAPLATFACHPTQCARLLALALSGSLSEYTVCERVTLSWGATGTLAWAGAGALRRMHAAFYAHVPDISHVARTRASTDYGLKPDLWQNADLADDEALSGLWHFLALSKSLVEDGCIRNSPWKHPGVRSVLRSPGEGYRSEVVAALLPDLPNRKVTIYRSAERTRALQLCGWGWGWENAGAGVERAEAAGTPCRAAALAAFHLRLRTALDVLARAQEPRLRIAALALAPGDERLWREALAAAAPALPDPYLRALLYFLAAANSPAPDPLPDYSAVLNETEMRLEDRVAFACIFLSDTKLHDYVTRICDELRARGDLSALLLTGISNDGIAVLQTWLENTGDVQSAALVAARCCPPELLRDARVRAWLAEYRQLLDAWRLWWPRCLLDTWVAAAGAGEMSGAGGASAGVACTYCGKPVAAAAHARPRPAFARLPPPAAKMKQISSCPNCRKPLPRCGVCSLHLGTGAGGVAALPAAPPAPPAPPAAPAPAATFGGWFSWCVACRHGGHAAHLLQWFSEHSECPVSSCSCRCSALDPPDPAPRPPHTPS
ncbi:GATOR complex protein MIOS-B isoform X2 [Maniola jurtina]|uniref:GATOR complex protein MIOS-B isoform X2 n=1 Tax=Maniola jurtina TaxID=191418 RepID=UPI001E6866EE|nr:GATOR complex protein MIOS-B isoform X2 [Maniola jurtina]